MSPTVELLKPSLDALSDADREDVIRYFAGLGEGEELISKEEWDAE
jgi:hypothetical protein